MRDIPSTPELQKFSSGGKYPNYLVRSWASSLGSVTQGHKALKSNYRSKWLERLNRVELLQNVEVQQTLRNTMRILKVTDNILQDSDSAYEFAEKRRVKKCHETVCKIRERELKKRATKPLKKCKDDPENTTSTEKHSKVKKIKHDKTSNGNTTQLPESDKAHTSSFNFDHSSNSHSFEQNDGSNAMNDYSFDNASIDGLFSGIFSSDRKLSSVEASKKRVSLPAILEGGQDQDKNDSSAQFPGKKIPGHLPSLPSLDAQSKFSIIKRVQEIRQERRADNKREKLSSLSSQVKRKYSKARKESLQNMNSRKIEIFADNSKILSSEQKTIVESSPVTLPLLDSKSFAEIDCNDYLNLKNRLDGLSPEKAVLDHKTYWPASS